ncbi:hypothetical protein ACJX0J_027106, partial [Zea mays]
PNLNFYFWRLLTYAIKYKILKPNLNFYFWRLLTYAIKYKQIFKFKKILFQSSTQLLLLGCTESGFSFSLCLQSSMIISYDWDLGGIYANEINFVGFTKLYIF